MSKNSNLLSPIIVVGIAPLLCLVVEAVGWNAIAAFSVAGFAITMGTIGHHLRVSEMRHLAFMGYGMLAISVVMALANSASRGSTGLAATLRSIVAVLEIGAILLAGAATLLAAIRYIILYGQNRNDWPAAGFVDTEIRCLTELESWNAEKEVQPRVQA